MQKRLRNAKERNFGDSEVDLNKCNDEQEIGEVKI